MMQLRSHALSKTAIYLNRLWSSVTGEYTPLFNMDMINQHPRDNSNVDLTIPVSTLRLQLTLTGAAVGGALAVILIIVIVVLVIVLISHRR